MAENTEQLGAMLKKAGEPENTPNELVIDQVSEIAQQQKKLSLQLDSMIKAYREIIRNMFHLQQENRELFVENEKIRARIKDLKKNIRELTEQSDFLESRLLEESAPQSQPQNLLSSVDAAFNEGSDHSQEKILIDKLKKENDNLKEENNTLRELESRLQQEFTELMDNSENHRADCGCDKRSFRRIKREPMVDAAEQLYEEAYGISKEKTAQKTDKQKEVQNRIYSMLKTALTEHHKEKGISLSREETRQLNEILFDKALDITLALLNIRDIGIHQVAQIINQTSIDPRGKKIDIVEANPGRFRKLCNVLGAKKSTEPYFLKLRETVSDALVMKIPETWREKEGTQKADKSLRDYAAKKANSYCKEFLGQNQLHPEVRRTNSMVGLQKIIHDCMMTDEGRPYTEENFRKLVSAATKIRMMHLAETIKSDIDFQHNEIIADHVRAKMAAHTDYTEDGRPVLTCGEPSEDGIYRGDDLRDKYSVMVDSIQIREKGEISTARKNVIKDAETGNDFDNNQIYDKIGVKISLTERDSVSDCAGQDSEDCTENPDEYLRREPPIEIATKKILAIFCAIFGTDIKKHRLRYTYEIGESNGFSTGKHRAFHVTLRYRHQCNVNGINGNGSPNMKDTYLEVQIVVKMDKKEENEDHKEYKIKQDRNIQNVTGMDRPFTRWLSDLVDIVLDEKEPICAALSPSNTTRLTDREISAKILFTALSKRGENGQLLNEDEVVYLLGDEFEKRKIRKAAKKYLHYNPVSRKNRMKIKAYNTNSRVELNRLAQQVLDVIEEFEEQES